LTNTTKTVKTEKGMKASKHALESNNQKTSADASKGTSESMRENPEASWPEGDES